MHHHLSASTISSEPRFRFNLLGTARLTRNGDRLTIPRRQVRALLFYLVAQTQPVPRGKLGFIFWPDKPEAIARRNLSRLLHQLKTFLGAGDILHQMEDTVSLDQEQLLSDVIEFLSAAQAKDYERAIALYGGTFLEGFSLPNVEFDHWMTNEAYRLQNLFLSCLDTSIQTHFSQKRFQEAIDLARRYLEIDELAEPIHRRLIELYALNGNRAAALMQYEHCLLILERELGVDALPETQALVQAVLRDQSLQYEQRADPLSQPKHSLTAMPFVGRAEIIAKLEQSFAIASAKQGQFILLNGEAGIGKTRMLHHFIDLVNERCTMLQATADQSMQKLPYQLIAQALRSGLEDGPIPAIRQPSRISEAARILPELSSLYPGLPPLLPLDSEGAQLRLFDAMCQFALDWVQTDRPLVFCLDDLHWADGVSLQWLTYFGAQILSQPILILASYHQDEQTILEPLRQALSRQGLLTHVSISGLDLVETQQAITTLDLPWRSDKDLIQRVWRQASGNPFFIQETLRSLMESRPGLKPGQDEPLPLPESVVQAVDIRLNLLDKVTRQVLDAAAVIGKSFSFELVKQVSGRSELESGGALEALIARNLLIEQGRVYAFQHEIIQVAVYNGLSQWRRRLLHRRVAKALSELEPLSHARLSRHYELGELSKEAAEEAIRAGAAIKTIFAYREALSHFNRALDLLDQAAAKFLDTQVQANIWRLRIQALAERGWVYRLLGKMDAYEQDLEQETRIVEKLGDQRARVQLHLRQAALQRWWCRYDQTLEAAQQGLLLNREVGDPVLEGRGWREIGLAYRENGNFPQAQPALEKALRCFEREDDPVLQIHVLSNLSTLFGHQGNFERARDFAQQALNLCDQRDLVYDRRLPLGDLGAAAAGMDQWKLAQDHLEESLKIARQIDDRTQEIFCLAHLGWVAFGQNQIKFAQELLTEALDLAERVNSCAEKSRLHISLAQTYFAKGERQKAATHAEMALKLANSLGRGLEIRIAKDLLARIKENA